MTDSKYQVGDTVLKTYENVGMSFPATVVDVFQLNAEHVQSLKGVISDVREGDWALTTEDEGGERRIHLQNDAEISPVSEPEVAP